MKLIKKLFWTIKKDGLWKAIQKSRGKCAAICVRLPQAFKEKYQGKRQIAKLSGELKGMDVFVIASCLEWNMPLFQRAHQLAVELAKREGNIGVLFVTEQNRYDNFNSYKKLNDRLWLFSSRLKKNLNMALETAERVTLFISWMNHYDLVDSMAYDRLIYDYVDEISLDVLYSSKMEEQHRRLMRKADLTVCSAVELYRKAQSFSAKAILCENACDYEFFRKSRGHEINRKLNRRMQGFSNVIGYYGSLASWVDYETIKEVAGKRSDWLFVLIGYNYDGTCERLELNSNYNIIWIPAVPYQELLDYIPAFDILTIPFLVNEITASVSPVKLFEYMACGKPILTSRLPECMRYRSVFTYNTAEDFVQKIEYLAALDKDSEYFRIMEKEAQENTWKARVDRILQGLPAGE